MYFDIFQQKQSNKTKMGRPSINDKAMTNAERQKRFRQRRKQEKEAQLQDKQQ